MKDINNSSRIWVGGGEVSHPYDAQRAARDYFLTRLESKAEEVLIDLRSLQPLHERVFSVALHEQPNDGFIVYETDYYTLLTCGDANGVRRLELPTLFRVQSNPEELSQLRASLIEWAEKWHLQAPDGWILEAALDLLGWWRVSQLSDGTQWESGFRAGIGTPAPEKTQIAVPIIEMAFHWNPLFEREAFFREQAEKDFRQRLNTYCNEVMRSMEEFGFERTLPKQELLHYDWLVLYLTRQPQNFATVANTVAKQESTVREPIIDLAKYIGLELPPTRGRGRPPKQAASR